MKIYVTHRTQCPGAMAVEKLQDSAKALRHVAGALGKEAAGFYHQNVGLLGDSGDWNNAKKIPCQQRHSGEIGVTRSCVPKMEQPHRINNLPQRNS